MDRLLACSRSKCCACRTGSNCSSNRFPAVVSAPVRRETGPDGRGCRAMSVGAAGGLSARQKAVNSNDRPCNCWSMASMECSPPFREPNSKQECDLFHVSFCFRELVELRLENGFPCFPQAGFRDFQRVLFPVLAVKQFQREHTPEAGLVNHAKDVGERCHAVARINAVWRR